MVENEVSDLRNIIEAMGERIICLERDLIEHREHTLRIGELDDNTLINLASAAHDHQERLNRIEAYLWPGAMKDHDAITQIVGHVKPSKTNLDFRK